MDERIRRMSVDNAIASGAELFANWEKQVASMKAEARNEMPDIFKAVRNEGHIGGLECEALIAKTDALFTGFEASLIAFHAELTERAKEAGIDLPQRSGGR